MDWAYVIAVVLGGGTIVGLATAILNHFANVQINRETAVARRNQTADNSVSSALNTLGHTIQELREENVDLRRRMTEMEAARRLEQETSKREKLEWKGQMADLRRELSQVEEQARREVAERDKKIEALTETVAQLQAELTHAKRGTGLNYTQRRKQ